MTRIQRTERLPAKPLPQRERVGQRTRLPASEMLQARQDVVGDDARLDQPLAVPACRRRLALDEVTIRDARKADARIDRELDRAPGPRVDLDQAELAGGVLAELHHDEAGPTGPPEDLVRARSHGVVPVRDPRRGRAAGGRVLAKSSVHERRLDFASIDERLEADAETSELALQHPRPVFADAAHALRARLAARLREPRSLEDAGLRQGFGEELREARLVAQRVVPRLVAEREHDSQALDLSARGVQRRDLGRVHGEDDLGSNQFELAKHGRSECVRGAARIRILRIEP